MIERRRIVELWRKGAAQALVTLVRVEGSSYRRTGARLLIGAGAEYAGAISGGCLEAEVVRKAAWRIRGGAVVDRYSTMFDDTAEIPYGLGCGGTVDLLLEPADTAELAALMEALEATLGGARRRVVTQLPGAERGLARMVTDGEGRELFRSATFEVGRDVGTDEFEEWLDPPQRLVVFGAGDDAQPMVSAAAMMGWRVAVVDGRSQWATRERFPGAERVQTSLKGVDIGADDAVIVMTHSYEQDRAWMCEVLPRSPKYLGLLGARHRSALLLSEAAAMLGWELERACARVFAPVGLDLGGDGAEAIALAAIAEVQAVVSGKIPAVRRMSVAEIEEQVKSGGASRYLQAQCAL